MEKFHGGIQLVSNYDIWNHDEDTKPFHYGLDSKYTGIDSGIWQKLIANDVPRIKELIQDGKIIQKYVENSDKMACRTSFECTLDGKYKCIALNRALVSSLTFESVWDSDKYDIMLSFYFNGTDWKFSMYTDKKGIDVSELCASFGGGGHKQASGFTWFGKTLPERIFG
jgi:hypothetical protein